MEFEWDPQKARSNRRKHGVRFADATAVFRDELAVTMPDESSDEKRFITIGMDVVGRLLVVVYSWRGVMIRVISARKATGPERRRYEEKR